MPKAKNNKNWSKEDAQYLTENYGKVDIKELAHRLERTEDGIRGRASDLGLTDKKTYWTKEELIFLAENLTTLTYKEMADKLGRTVRSVAHKVSDVKIARLFKAPELDALENDVAFFKGKSGEYKALLSAMEIGQSFVYPAEDRQTLQNQIKYFPDRVYRTKREDENTRRVWRLL
jgi:hypothetical protein